MQNTRASNTPTRPGRRHRLAGNKAFTIIEVAMASFVMAFGIATSIVGMQAGFKHIDLARGTTVASQIIQSEMERLRLMSWTTISALPTSESFDGAQNFSSNSDVVGKYSVTRQVAPDSARPDDVKYITISVVWSGYDGRRHARSFQSMYVKNGLYDYYYTLAKP